jgi:1-pyrroline-5-carboxylate dehydrogenase
MTTATKITYTSASGDLDEFHQRFDAGLAAVRAASGGDHPCMIGDRAVTGSAAPLEDRSPIDTRVLLGRFAVAGSAELDQAVGAARAAQRDWGRRPWGERVALLRRAAQRSWRSRWARAGSRRWGTPRSRPT